ncbi:aldose 1-epimerase [Dongia rigui]|uniref:Aldose 1-epimerase n=1 Tax=Dongia rigui TaxID=940149 RepID=A0ABU5DUI5_9PROT|nr:aldose 1-epimerase [Dongia rigui]MDY0870955.1 aldose 1-epimerase [Dongia rigui]
MSSARLLQAADYALTLYPEIGGAIGRFTWRGIDLLRPMSEAAVDAGNSEGAGCFPLFPFSNRIRNGQFRFEGRDIYLPRNTSGPHVEHGHGWQRPWEVIEADAGSATIGFTHDPANDGSWPFAYHAEMRFELSDAGLAVNLVATNQDVLAMPFGCGLHPYFPRTPRSSLTATVRGFWETDAEVMPTRHVGVPERLDLNRGLAMEDVVVDNVFTGFGGVARIAWPEQQVGLRLEADPVFAQLVLYVPDAATQAAEAVGGTPPYFCAEPVSNITDAFNLSGKTGMITLASGETFSASIRFAAHELTTG